MAKRQGFQLGAPGTSYAISIAEQSASLEPPDIPVPGKDSPVKEIDSDGLRNLGFKLSQLWTQYRSDRRIAELRWLRNERQYLGLYDPDIDKELAPNRSRAYPKLTRVKCISVLSRIMNIIFPGDERNWAIKASPNAAMSVDDIKQAVQDAQKRDQGEGTSSDLNDPEWIEDAVQALADKRADALEELIDDQLQEIGGDQTKDYISLNRKVLQGGIQYGLGLLKGPFIKEKKKTVWRIGPDGTPSPTVKSVKMPVFEYLKIWDFYPDLSAKTLESMDGYFERLVMSRSQLLALSKREDFFEDQIRHYLESHATGNYIPLEFELELRVMGVRMNVNEMKAESTKYEILVWHGKMAGNYLVMAGIEIEDGKLADELDAEIWTIAGTVISAKLNPWVTLGMDVKTLHWFLFDEDDTSPVGFGLPNVMRDTQMSISAATRMLMDNASVVCGPQLELNTELLRLDQDLREISAYKIWYREGTGPDAQWPAVRNIDVNAHLDDLIKIIEMFMKFADTETFVGPATGGDMQEAPSEPMRTAAGASMLRGDAALPFKDIVRSYDQFTQSVILSLVQFNRKFNPEQVQEGDYDVIARGATSLMARELRGAQIDNITQNMTPEEAYHVDMRKLIEAKFKVRDLVDLLVPEAEAEARKSATDQAAGQQQDQQKELMDAQIREILATAFSKIAQGQKNSANANAASINSALELLEAGVMNAVHGGSGAAQQNGSTTGGAAGGAQQPAQPGGGAGDADAVQTAGIPATNGAAAPAGLPGGGLGQAPGAGQGLQ